MKMWNAVLFEIHLDQDSVEPSDDWHLDSFVVFLFHQRLKFLRREADGKTLVELNPGGQRPPYGEKACFQVLGVSVLAVGYVEVKAGMPRKYAWPARKGSPWWLS
jgi:hypothetical protein